MAQWGRRQAKHMKSWYILDCHILRCARRLLVSHHCAWWRNNHRKRRAQKPSYRAGECCAKFYTIMPVSESPFQTNPSIDWPMTARYYSMISARIVVYISWLLTRTILAGAASPVRTFSIMMASCRRCDQTFFSFLQGNMQRRVRCSTHLDISISHLAQAS